MLAIVIPAYKRPECLRQALESLTVQTNKKFFVVVVDDASPEPLEPVVKEFENRLRITYLRQEENGGPGVARQTGLDFIHKNNIDLVMFLDSDDMLYPNAVDRLTYEINVGLKDIVSSAIWTEQNKSTGFMLESNNKTWLHGKIFRVKYLYDNKIYFPNIKANEDLAFNLKAILNSKKSGHIQEVLYLFRDEQRSITRDNSTGTLKRILSVDYIDAIYDAYNYFVKEKQMSLPYQLIVNIFGIYNYYQVGLYAYGDVSEKTKQNIKEMYHHPEIQGIINKTSFFARYMSIFKQFYYHKKQIYWFSQTLKEFLEEFAS
jgi:glycosyltransferase involved in cell wall biosynthesis